MTDRDFPTSGKSLFAPPGNEGRKGALFPASSNSSEDKSAEKRRKRTFSRATRNDQEREEGRKWKGRRRNSKGRGETETQIFQTKIIKKGFKMSLNYISVLELSKTAKRQYQPFLDLGFSRQSGVEREWGKEAKENRACTWSLQEKEEEEEEVSKKSLSRTKEEVSLPPATRISLPLLTPFDVLVWNRRFEQGFPFNFLHFLMYSFEIVFFVVCILWGGFPCLSSSWKALIYFWMGGFIISEHVATLLYSHLITPWQFLLYVQSFISPCGLSVCVLSGVYLCHTQKTLLLLSPFPLSLLSSPRQSQGSIRIEFHGAFLSSLSGPNP